MKTFSSFLEEAFRQRTPSEKRQARKQQNRNLQRAALKRAGIPAAGIIGVSPKRREEIQHDSDGVTTSIVTHKSPAQFALASAGSRLAGETTRNSYTRNIRNVYRQARKSGASKKSTIHNVDIVPNLERDHGDTENLRQRHSNFRRAIHDIPNALKRSGAKSGHIIIGKPGQTQKGGPEAAGIRSRTKLYSKILPQGKFNSKTGYVFGKV